jgi:hypothetical protein
MSKNHSKLKDNILDFSQNQIIRSLILAGLRPTYKVSRPAWPVGRIVPGSNGFSRIIFS